MNISPLIAIVPVVLAVALIIIVVRRNITERRPGEPIDIAGAIPAFVVLMVAVVFIGGMASSVVPYTWDEESGELTINQNVGTGSQEWDSLGADVKSLIINDNVRSVADGAFDTLTALEYVSIESNVEVRAGAFSAEFIDPFGNTVTDLAGAEYIGLGDGTLYQADLSILSFDSSGSTVTGLADTSAINIAIPKKNGSVTIEAIAESAFSGKSIEVVLASPDSQILDVKRTSFQSCASLTVASFPEATVLRYGVFQNCASLEKALMPKVTSASSFAFNGCAALVEADFPLITSIGSSSFKGCAALVEADFPQVTTVGDNAFVDCTSLTTVRLPSLTTVGYVAFQGCTAIEEVELGPLSSIQSNSFASWTFYASDGTTSLSKTAANLAGKTFMGTAAALVEVTAGTLSLTPDQIQQVHLHDQELQTMLDQPSIDPLPFQPSLQTQEQEPAAA